MKKINTFWNWFQDNHHTIKNIVNETPQKQKHIAFWINKNLNYYCKEIDFIIVYPKNGNSKAEFIITANGNPECFNQVITLVDNAPILRNWKFTAFIQPTVEIDKIINGLDEPYIFHEINLKTSEIKFLALHYDENIAKLDIIVFLKNFAISCDNKTLSQAIFIIMQDLLGEKSLFQNIHFVQLAQLPDNEENLIHLYELQFYIDLINNSCK